MRRTVVLINARKAVTRFRVALLTYAPGAGYFTFASEVQILKSETRVMTHLVVQFEILGIRDAAQERPP